MVTTLTNVSLGQRVEFLGVGPATVVYSKKKHSVTSYQGFVLIKIDHTHQGGDNYDHYGWDGTDGSLVPDDAQHLRLEHNLLWVKKSRLALSDIYDGFEVDQ